ncbi:MAG: hypothetical protein LBL24_09615 [Bacteroidales bacterium]|jgi:hypothetical protein|nr:hypothetical protein [Bacteroidales bacterium]
MKSFFIKRVTIQIIFIVSISLFNSCVTTQSVPQKTDAEKIEDVRKSWIGKHEKSLYAHSHWGIPDRTGTDGSGGKIATYYRTNGGYTPYTGYISVTWITSFFINGNGIIYNMTVRRG